FNSLFRSSRPKPIKTTKETITGAPTEIDNGTVITFVKTNVNNPAKTEEIAAFSLECLNIGSKPSTIGTEIRPINAPNHSIINPITPPNRSFWIPINKVKKVKTNVVIRAIRSDCLCVRSLNLSDIVGRISLVITAEIVFASEEVIDIVAENNPAKTRPTKPAGSNSIANKP